jgi:hypothetical protein
VAYPPLAQKVKKYKEFFKNRGIDFGFGAFLGVYNKELYPAAYTAEEIKIFGLDREPPRGGFYPKGKVCNAGYNIGLVYPGGAIHPCFNIKEPMGNIYQAIAFRKKPIICPVNYCRCPVNTYDQHLFEESLRNNASCT